MPSIQHATDAAIYKFFLDQLPLYDSEARALTKAFGWDSFTSLYLKMRSAPSFVARILACGALREEFGDRDKLPAGFYYEPTNTSIGDELDDFGELPPETLRFNCPPRGLLVPVRRGTLRGLQYYRFPKDERPRWITTCDLPAGSSQVASIHVHGRMVGNKTGKAFLVANSLEAYAVALRYHQCAVALNNASLHSLPAQLFEALPMLRGIVIAIKEPPSRLTQELTAMGVSVNFWKGGELL
jgi:hypothetical protein